MNKYVAKKRFGQNFLEDQSVISQIINIINPKSQDKLVEIGPGLGALTYPLLEKINHLDVIEIDRDIIAYLGKNLSDKITIHNGDALKFDYSFNNQQIRIVGNLPYNISTPLLFHLAKFNNIIDMHFMLQKEVVDRLCAKPNCGDYGRLSVMMQYKFNCLKMLDVSRECFRPAPKVESAIIRIKPLAQELQYNVDEKKLGYIVTQAFSKRRKTITNSLKNIITPEMFSKLGIDPQKRAENLTVAEYVALTNTYSA
jgi:16S rRNA (adenine1518-N6/adenine1519-N6)-dimethyltransferase